MAIASSTYPMNSVHSSDPSWEMAGHKDESKHWFWHFSIARIGVLSFVTLGTAQMGIDQGAWVLLLVYAFAFASSAAFVNTLRLHGNVGVNQTWAQIMVDFSVVALTVALTHGETSFFTFIFVVVVLETGLLLGFRQSFGIASLATTFMLWEHWSTPNATQQLETFALWYNFLVQALAFYLTAFVSDYWNHRITRLQEFQEEILDNLSHGFMIVDKDGLVTVHNQACNKILKLRNQSLNKIPIENLLSPKSGDECPVQTALRSDQDYTGYEFPIRMPNGQQILIGLTTNKIIDRDKQLTGLIVSFDDLTEISQMREEVMRNDRMAIVGELAAGLAHEIRNPVAVIRGAVEELPHHEAESNTCGKLQKMALRESDHLNEIVSGFLDFAREPSNKRKQIALCPLISEIVELLQREFQGKEQLTISTEFVQDDIVVSSDPSQLKQVFINLAKNGIEAMNAKGHLRISIYQSNDGPVEIRFDDDGMGIDPDKAGRIFEPFYTTKDTGVGMGLAVCLRIITAHDGTIRAANREKGGCSIHVSLPIFNPLTEESIS
jgi:two-component system sensor histidine kinase PilS (NtrC family)